MVRVQRVYDPSDRDDNVHILVDRLWPRGVKKEDAPFSEWAKEAAPSTELRKWAHAHPARWPEFVRRYRAELDERPEAWRPLLSHAREGRLTLLYAARDRERNHAVVLAGYLEDHLERT